MKDKASWGPADYFANDMGIITMVAICGLVIFLAFEGISSGVTSAFIDWGWAHPDKTGKGYVGCIDGHLEIKNIVFDQRNLSAPILTIPKNPCTKGSP